MKGVRVGTKQSQVTTKVNSTRTPGAVKHTKGGGGSTSTKYPRR